MPTLKVHYDGWLCLPPELRQQLALNTGDRLKAEVVDGALVLQPVRRGRPAAPHEVEAADPPAAATSTIVTVDAVPAKRGPGRPRKVDVVGEAVPPSGPKRARGRPRNATIVPSASETVPVISEPGKLRKKVDLQAATPIEEPVSSPARRPERPRIDVSPYIVERRPFRQVEVKKLGPGRGHNKHRLPA